ATGVMVQRSLEAADQLAQEGIDVEVVDPRTLRPLDTETVVDSVKKTGKVLIVHEAVKTGGYGGELVSVIAESEAFGYLEAPIVRLAGKEVPIPYNRDLERAAVPQIEDILEKARDLVKVRV
ncbi:MAG TPA: transketolase C-terminal domain-containing protein, partial [Anaerolineales bacterium]|nr:transketolase C-terminal domain-containing protein [Anaerolineales bacterium]